MYDLPRQNDYGFLSLCYHYIRPPLDADKYPDLLGNRIKTFKEHLEMLQQNYQLISPSQAREYLYDNVLLSNTKPGMLITFDDGLSDHYHAARILNEYGIKALFFIPTCILKDKEPANPIIIHYALAINRISGFIEAFDNAKEEFDLQNEDYQLSYNPETDTIWGTIKKIKSIFKYKLHYNDARKILLHIYRNTLQNKDKNILYDMHLDHDKVQNMLEMGHSIGVHTNSHISVAASDLSRKDFQSEIIEPKTYLENTFNTEVFSFSYPFGGKQDCLSTKALIDKTEIYDLAFTVEKIVNSKKTSPHELGRYMPMSTDSANDLKQILDKIRANPKGQ